jgi:hypothetical protein
MQKVTKKQKENSAKYLYDISKLTFTLAILGNLLAWEKFNLQAFWFGIMGSVVTFTWAYILDKEEA